MRLVKKLTRWALIALAVCAFVALNVGSYYEAQRDPTGKMGLALVMMLDAVLATIGFIALWTWASE